MTLWHAQVSIKSVTICIISAKSSLNSLQFTPSELPSDMKPLIASTGTDREVRCTSYKSDPCVQQCIHYKNNTAKWIIINKNYCKITGKEYTFLTVIGHYTFRLMQ